jgi:cellulose synthase/poly-beta-1,6-N-acetylglucosamine synthase-like glycosyltransferase
MFGADQRVSQTSPYTTPLISPALLGIFLGVPLASTAASRPYTVIVPLHNKEATIRATLESIFAQTRKPYQVIVVNDASTDGSRKILEEFKDKIMIIDNEENIGKAASINKALKLATTPYVLLVDADTVLDPRFAEEAMRGFTRRRIAGVSGVVLPTQIKTRTEHARLIEYLLGSSHKRTQLRLGGVWTLAGCSMMWRTDILRRIGGVPTGSIVEDMDASWKAQATDSGDGTKYSLGYNPKALAYTDEPKRSGNMSTRRIAGSVLEA